MRGRQFTNVLIVLSAISLVYATATAQKPNPVAKVARPMMFAVLNDGKTLEPIAYINKGKLEAAVDGSTESNIISVFNKTYYKSGTVYRLIFGGATAGTVTVKTSDPKGECIAHMAQATTNALKTPLKGNVMGLATNSQNASTAASYRRKPTIAEKVEIDALARAEFAKQKLAPAILRSQNLTALDLDNDGKAEFVGSYWVEIDKLTRALLFLIAGKGSNGKYLIGYQDYRTIEQANVMSGDIKNVDEGVYHELLLDAFDYDGDGVSNIFTYVQSFEGAGFNAYSRSGSKWVKSFEGSNYHCGY